jgi:carbon monoxide dehydrogenase subunit G
VAYVERGISINAPPAVVWSVMADVERWPEWTASIRSVEAFDGAELAVGRRYRIAARGVPAATWRVERVDDGRGFVWVTTSGIRIIAGHTIEPEDGGCNVTLSIRTEGLLAALFGPAITRLSRRNMELEAEGLKRRSEERARA